MRTMKDSGVEWIGEIPSDWEVTRLRFLCDIQTGNMDTQNNNPEGKYPFYVRSPIIEYSDDFTFDNEAVLMAGDGVGAGKVFHYVSGKYGCHQRVYSISDFKGVKGKFIYYYLSENFYKKIEENNAKSTVDSVRMPMLKDFPVVLPIYETQQRIADFLDKKCGKIDEIIEREQVVIEKLKEYKQSVITEAVTKGLNPHAEMKDRGIDWIGSIPKLWELTKLKYFVVTTKGFAFKGDDFVNEGYPIVKVSDIKNGTVQKGESYLSEKKYNFYHKFCIYSTDILMTTVGSNPNIIDSAVGQVALVPKNFNGALLNQNAVRLHSDKKSLNQYLFYCLNIKRFREHLNLIAHGTANQSSISLVDILDFSIPLPPLEEQQQIADYLDSKCAKIDKTIEAKQSVIDKLTEYKKSLIYEVVTGKKEV